MVQNLFFGKNGHSGWWDSTGFSTDLSFSNYIAGTWNCVPPFCDPTTPVETRNFFVFDLTDVVGTVTSATLRLSTAASWQGTYSIWDVESTIPDLRRALTPGELRPLVYDDLGEGDSYGSPESIASSALPGNIIDIQLTAAALTSINAKDGCNPAPSVDCLWAIGGSFNPDFGFPFSNAFGNSGEEVNGGGVRQLIYSTAPIPAVPVPAAIWLFGTALIGLVGFGKRRKVA